MMSYKELEQRVNPFQGEGQYSVVLDEFFGYGIWHTCFTGLNKGMAKAIANYLNRVSPDCQVYNVMSDMEATKRVV